MQQVAVCAFYGWFAICEKKKKEQSRRRRGGENVSFLTVSEKRNLIGVFCMGFNTSLINHYGILSHHMQPMTFWPVCPSDPKIIKPVMIIFILAVGGSILIILAKMCSEIGRAHV